MICVNVGFKNPVHMEILFVDKLDNEVCRGRSERSRGRVEVVYRINHNGLVGGGVAHHIAVAVGILIKKGANNRG